MTTYPKRLIEVDLPIKRISAHARREKSIRHGHISTLHIWWARRPLASSRAIICATLWPDPADALCPDAFREVARARMREWTERHLALVSPESYHHFKDVQKNPARLDHDDELLRTLLLDFIADFANWDNSTSEPYLETSRMLTQAAHEALGGEPGTRPLVVDPFAGGGAIPLEALRVGADAFASDLNPVAVLLNKVVLEYIPKYGQRLADEVRKWGQWIKEEADKELAEFYPKDPDGATPIAYLWARTIRCEGPGCGAEVPLIRSLWLAKRSKNAVALRLVPNHAEKRMDFEIIHDAKAKDVGDGTVRKGSATCPVCGYTTPVAAVRLQLRERHGGTADARLFCVITTQASQLGRSYRIAQARDQQIAFCAAEVLRQYHHQLGQISMIPHEEFSGAEPRRIPLPLYGIRNFGDMFGPRQTLALVTLINGLRKAARQADLDTTLESALQTCLALVVDRQADKLSSLARWDASRENPQGTFGRQALAMVWDYCEVNPLSGAGGDWDTALDWVVRVLQQNERSLGLTDRRQGQVQRMSATSIQLPDEMVDALITDPPYYYSVPYADLSDFFYVWLRRALFDIHPDLFESRLVPKEEECIQNLPHSEVAHLQKGRTFYENSMLQAFKQASRITRLNGIGTVVFAHSDTDAWESLLWALTTGGWQVTASWPIDTEMSSRILAQRQSVLASSVHLVCRPREVSSANTIGDWRDVLAELPQRVHEWMPRLVSEGVVGADAIFACLGPAVEIFSRYERVEKASGEVVTLREFLPYVWAAVSREALSTIFAEADATGFEENARLTALWLWTLFGGQSTQNVQGSLWIEDESEPDEQDEEGEHRANTKPAVGGTYVLEFDAARKLAQGLGAHLEKLTAVVEVKGDKARLLPVAERARALFGKEQAQPAMVGRRQRSAVVQTALPGFPAHPQQAAFGELIDEAATAGDGASPGWNDTSTPEPGGTVLDRVHQSMLLFAAGRTEALRRFLIEDGAGKDERFWRLAQALSALYPMGSDEKRWVDGVLARKKGWGL